jgi:hypothetical protein
MSSSAGATVIGALEGAISVLLTLGAGFVACQHGLLDKSSTKKLSHLCSVLFLPCLLIVQMGPQLTPDMLKRAWVIPLWGLLSTAMAHLFGWAGKVRSHDHIKHSTSTYKLCSEGLQAPQLDDRRRWEAKLFGPSSTGAYTPHILPPTPNTNRTNHIAY